MTEPLQTRPEAGSTLTPDHTQVKTNLDRLDRLILNAIQSDFPVTSRPYLTLAQQLSPDLWGHQATEEEIWLRVKNLRRNGYIRRIGAVFNAGPLGYRSTLCAAKVPTEKLTLFTELVNQAPQVTHNYLRSAEINVWFTFTGQRAGELADFMAELKNQTGVHDLYVLEAEKLFKIKVDFKFSEK